MAIAHPLPEPLVELIAARFRVIGEPMRIKLLDCLRESPATVNELTGTLGASQQNVSKHLNLLHQAGLVSRAKQGTTVRYAIADETVFALCELVCGGLRAQMAELDEILAAGGDMSGQAALDPVMPLHGKHSRQAFALGVPCDARPGLFAPRVEKGAVRSQGQATGSQSVHTRQVISAPFTGCP